MTLDEYQAAAMRTANKLMGKDAWLYGALAVVGEAGEYSEVVKKSIYHGHAISFEKAMAELGDVLWGIAYAAASFGVTLEQVAAANIEKLKARYPDGFSTERSINRAE